MLDENLPAFFFKKSIQGVKHHTTILASYRGSEPTPTYTLQHADPNSLVSRNCYAAAIFDAYNPEVLYGEVLLRPQWSQPTPSQDDIRRNKGVPPPPLPKNPTHFTVQLYNPEQQIQISLKTSSWGSTTYEFSVPQTTFRAPSTSALDKSLSDPGAYPTTPRLNFVWRRENKLSRDYTVYMTGTSTDAASRRKGKDPDIAVALFRSMRELTVYESNLARLEMEDVKGLEIVFLLSAATIKDVFHNSNIREAFNIDDQAPVMADGRPPLTPIGVSPTNPSTTTTNPQNDRAQSSTSKALSQSRPPPLPDARAKWELDAETARLAAQAKREADVFAQRARDRERADEVERQRLLRMVRDEERQAIERQRAVDAETERLRREYGVSPGGGSSAPGDRTSRRASEAVQRPVSSSGYRRRSGSQGRRHRNSHGAYMSGAMLSPESESASQGAAAAAAASGGSGRKKSFWGSLLEDAGLRDESRESRRLSKKASAMW